MSTYFEENRKLLGVSGIIGRRDFIINCIIIEIIESLLFATPFVYYIMTHPNLLSGFKSMTSAPQWYYIWLAAAGIVSSVLYFQSIIRRVRDIIGIEEENRISIISAILTVLNFLSYLPVLGIGKFISLAVLIVLAFMEGKITSKKPASNIIKFNWGAFFGTWLWGLFNKTPLTLLMIPLSFTLAGFPFMILCGLKGNEWAYNNKKCDNIEKFHNSQMNQTIIFAILTPVIMFFGSIFFTVVSGKALINYSKTHPEFAKKAISAMLQYQAISAESTFEEIEINNGEYKFYLNPEQWQNISNPMRASIMKTAAAYAMTKENTPITERNNLSNQIDILKRVKIYSSFNNEILGEFYISPEHAKKVNADLKNKKLTAKEFQKIWTAGYKFNNNPSLP